MHSTLFLLLLSSLSASKPWSYTKPWGISDEDENKVYALTYRVHACLQSVFNTRILFLLVQIAQILTVSHRATEMQISQREQQSTNNSNPFANQFPNCWLCTPPPPTPLPNLCTQTLSQTTNSIQTSITRWSYPNLMPNHQLYPNLYKQLTIPKPYPKPPTLSKPLQPANHTQTLSQTTNFIQTSTNR